VLLLSYLSLVMFACYIVMCERVLSYPSVVVVAVVVVVVVVVVVDGKMT
jgi:hypothetical protein